MSDKNEAAHQMTHENFRKEFPPEKLKDTIAKVREEAGKLKSVTYKSERFVAKPKDQTLTVFFNVKGEKAELPGKVEFQFSGLKGHIIGFEVGPGAKE
jgi:hypothetical protein